MSKAAREYHLIDLVGTSYGGFQTLAGARQVAREEGLRAWDIFHGNDRIEYHDPDDRERSDVTSGCVCYSTLPRLKSQANTPIRWTVSAPTPNCLAILCRPARGGIPGDL
jgi:hypothetical protein